MKAGPAHAGCPPCHEPAPLLRLDDGCRAHLGGSGKWWVGSFPGPAQGMGIGLGQGCWGIKGSSKLIERFWGWEQGWGCGPGSQEELEAAARSSHQVWDDVGGGDGEFMAEKMVFCFFL